jgi:hypothetical protein
MAELTCTFSFEDKDGFTWSHVTMGHSAFDAARSAWKWFHDPHWQGPKPNEATLFHIYVTGIGRRYSVRAETFLKGWAER